MTLGFRDLKFTWPIFRAWWFGLWYGLMFGIFAGLWFARSRSIDMPFRLVWWWLIPGGCTFIAFLPRTIFQISQGVSRFRAAARGDVRVP
jgi:hypothetical protein